MNMTTKATLAEFVETDAGSAFLSSIDYAIDYPEILNGGVGWVSDLISEYDGENMEDNVLSTIEEVAGQFEDVARCLRGFILAYVEQRGAIKLASDAIEAFAAEPTEANRLALVQACEPFDGLEIPMSRALKGKLRPFVIGRHLKSRINFGSLHWIAKNYLKVEAPVKEAA